MSEPSENKVELRTLFLGLQSQMIAQLSTNRYNILHPGTKGDASELRWLETLQSYLPKRYQVEKAFVLDCDGNLSEQVDLIIFDRQYSPFLFNQDGALYVPAESVYGVLEVKQDLGKGELEYAGAKAASVRRLRRTSAPIPHAGGVYPPRTPSHILAGILTLGCSWKPPFGSVFKSALANLSPECRIELGCALQNGSFSITHSGNGNIVVDISEEGESLIFFFLRLLSCLQSLATVPMLDVNEYAKSLNKG